MQGGWLLAGLEVCVGGGGWWGKVNAAFTAISLCLNKYESSENLLAWFIAFRETMKKAKKSLRKAFHQSSSNNREGKKPGNDVPKGDVREDSAENKVSLFSLEQ